MRLTCPVTLNAQPRFAISSVPCCGCGKMVKTSEVVCDLDGPSFVAYFCDPCVGLNFTPDGPSANPTADYLKEQNER